MDSRKDCVNRDRNLDSLEFCSGTNTFAAPQMPPHGYMMGNRPSFPNNSQKFFSRGPMNMMDAPKMIDDVAFNPFWNKNSMERMPCPQPTIEVQKEVLTFPSSVLYPPPPGYYMKIANRDDPPNCGRLHVNYSCTREDQSEYECEQNKLSEQMKHRRKHEEESWPRRPTSPSSPSSPPSPPKPVIYNENEASDIHEKLKKDDTMIRAMDILITWMERGNCTRKTDNVFYGFLQTINSNVRRLMSEKEAKEEEIRKLQESFRNRFSKILTQFEHVEKVFKTAGKQKSWDHFTKAQRKNIDFWSKQIQESRMSQQEELFNKYKDDSMEMSDGEDGKTGTSVEPPPKKKKSEIDVDMRYENDALKCQLEAYKNEIAIAKQESLNSLEMKNKKIKELQLALQGMQKQLIASRELSNNSEKSSSANESTILDSTCQDVLTHKTANSDESETRSMENTTSVSVVSPSQMSSRNELSISQNELKLIGLISCFLNVHPTGASPDYISSYLKQMEIVVCANEIEELLERLPSLFKQEVSGCRATLKRRWKFTGFHK